jgi:PhnB protein
MEPALCPYLNFNGTTKDAMEFYQSILGGDLVMQTYGESGMSQSEEDKGKIMHAELRNKDLSFMASDGNPEHPVHMGDNIHMSIVGSDETLLSEWFDSLADGGTVDMPLAKQFWGDTFGMLTDKFGVHWMVNISSGEAPQEVPDMPQQ